MSGPGFTMPFEAEFAALGFMLFAVILAIAVAAFTIAGRDAWRDYRPARVADDAPPPRLTVRIAVDASQAQAKLAQVDELHRGRRIPFDLVAADDPGALDELRVRLDRERHTIVEFPDEDDR